MLSTFITVTLSNGILLAFTQALALVLYFVGEVGWSDCSAVLVPRLATVTLLTSILRPREAFRTLQRQQLEREQEERREMEAAGMTGWVGGGGGSGGTAGTTLCGSCCTKRGGGLVSPGSMAGELSEMGVGGGGGFEVGVLRRQSEPVM